MGSRNLLQDYPIHNMSLWVLVIYRRETRYEPWRRVAPLRCSGVTLVHYPMNLIDKHNVKGFSTNSVSFCLARRQRIHSYGGIILFMMLHGLSIPAVSGQLTRINRASGSWCFKSAFTMSPDWHARCNGNAYHSSWEFRSIRKNGASYSRYILLQDEKIYPPGKENHLYLNIDLLLDISHA